MHVTGTGRVVRHMKHEYKKQIYHLLLMSKKLYSLLKNKDSY